MFRIARICFLHRLKGNMSGDAHDFKNIETRALINILFLQGKTQGNSRHSERNVLAEHVASYATVNNRVAQFKHGDFSTCDIPRPRRNKTVTTTEIIDQIQELILEYRRISAKSTAELLGISHERVGSMTHEDLYMRKMSVIWVPKCLNADKNFNGASLLNNFGNFFGTIHMISCRDWWPYMKPCYITLTQRPSNNQWSGGIVAQYPPPKKKSD